MYHHRAIIRSRILLLALALVGNSTLSAETIERIVKLSTVSGTSQNRFAIQGTLNTLAQGLNVVPFARPTSTGVQGTLCAKLTIETFPAQNAVELIGVEFMENSFTQGSVSLFYDVPSTSKSRQVTFSANNVSFSLNLTDLVSSPPLSLAQLHPVSGYQIVQTGGIAEIGITDRPSKQQLLANQNVLSTYASQEPLQLVTLDNFTLVPIAGENNLYGVQFSLAMQHQQLLYDGVGLPVALNYSGSMQLGGQVRIIPEPATAALAVGAVIVLVCRRIPGIAFPG